MFYGLLGFNITAGAIYYHTEPPDTRLDLGSAQGTEKSEKPKVISDGGGHVYVVWEDKRDGKSDIYFNYSQDNGATWQNPDIRIDLGDNPGKYKSKNPVIAITNKEGESVTDKRYVYIAWVEKREKKKEGIYLNYSQDNGATWQSSAIEISRDKKPAKYSIPSVYAISDGHIYVLWHSTTKGKSYLFLNYSTDYGATWQPNAIKINRSGFTQPHESDEAYNTHGGIPIAAFPNGMVHVFWSQDVNGKEQLFSNYSMDFGLTWQGTDIRVGTGTGDSKHVALYHSPTDGHIYVVYEDNRDGDWGVYLSHSDMHGMPGTWKPDIRIDVGYGVQGSHSAKHPAIGGTNSHIYVSWLDLDKTVPSNDNRDIYFNVSTNHGETGSWLAASLRLNTSHPAGTFDAEPLHLRANTSGRVFVCWEEKHDNNGVEGEEIRLNYSDDYGSTWLSADIRVNNPPPNATNNEAEHHFSYLDDSGLLSFVWEDNRNGKMDIYYNRAMGGTAVDTESPVTTAVPIGDIYGAQLTVDLTATDNKDPIPTIYYTTDGTDPTVGGTTTISGPSPVTGIPITVTGLTILKFFAVDSSGNSETINTEQYTIDTSFPTTTASPPGNRYGSAQSVTLTANEPATIYYTTDGTTPAVGGPTTTSGPSPVTGIPISAEGITQLKFFAIDMVGNNEPINTEQYIIDTTPPTTIAEPIGTRVADPTVGVFATPIHVRLIPDEVATTYYTIDGSNPTTQSPVMGFDIHITGNTLLKFFSVDIIGNQEAIKSENYVIDTIPPVSSASVTTGTYRNPQTVTLSVTDNYDPTPLIFYTTDGSEPTMASILYTAPITISTTTTLKFFSMDMVMNHETTNTEVYTIYPLTAASPVGGIYSTTQYITLTSDPPSTIYYTTDGTTPVPGNPNTTSGMSPVTNIAIASSLTLNFFAVDSYGNTEPLKSETYTIDNNPPYTTASPVGGIYTGSQSVTLSAVDDTDPAPTIYYSLDGVDPTIGGANTYSGASPVQGITISSNTVLKFFAVDNLGNTEGIKREDYTIQVPPSVGHSWIWAIDDGARPTPRTQSDGTPIIVKTNGTGAKDPILRLRMVEYVDQGFTNEPITLVYTTDPTWSSNFFIVGEPGSAPSATNKFRFRNSQWIIHEGTAAFPSIFFDPMMSNLTISGIEIENYPALHSVTGDKYYEHDISLEYLGDETDTYYFRGVTRGELWSFSSMHGNQGPTVFTIASGQSKYLTFPLESFDTGYIADGLSPDTGSPAASYTYKVVYTDEGGSAPVNPNVYINSVSYIMSVDTGAADPLLSDGIYTNGEQYTYTISGSTLNLGLNNTYYFDFDGIKLPPSGNITGPSIGTDSEQHNWIWAYDNAANPNPRTSYENVPITVQKLGTGMGSPILRLRVMEHTLSSLNNVSLSLYYSTDPTGQTGLREVVDRTGVPLPADKFQFIDSTFLSHAQLLDTAYPAAMPALLLDHIGQSIAGLQIEEGGMVSGYNAGADEWREHDFAIKYIGDETAAYYFFGSSGGNVWTPVDIGGGARLDTLQSSLPIDPTNLVASALSTVAEIDLSWIDNSSNEVGFKIERKIGAGGAYTEIATVGVGAVAYNDTGLLPNTTYYYRVRAYNINGNSNYSNEVFAITPEVNAPGNLTATPLSTSQIDLLWSDNSANETEFVVQRALTQGAYSDIAILPAGSTSYSDTGLSADTEYFYRVMARITGGTNSAWSNEVNVRTLPLPPAAPTSLSVTVVSESRIDLSWIDNAANESGFKIERKIGAGGTYAEIDLIGGNFTNYNDTGLVPNTTYYYRIRATNAGGDSAYSNEASGTTVIITPPNSLSATAVSSSQVDLTWTDLSANETGYKIERKTGAAGTYAQIATVGQDITQFTDAGLIDGISYYYRVRGYNAQADSGYSNEANVVTPLNPPDNLTASTLSNDQIYLMWTDNSSSETGYEIERKTGVAGTYALVATLAANVNTYTDSGLNEITGYYYRIKAVNSVTGSPYSNEVNATTMLNPPTGVTATPVSGSQIDMTWIDNSSSETGYKIERKQGVSGTYTQIATTGADTVTYNDTGLSEAATYYYRVRAYDLIGDSPYSGEISTVTLLNAPGGLAAATVSASEIDLTWTDNSGFEDGFKIERKQGANGTYAEIASLPAGTISYNDTGLTDSTTYYYRVWAYSNTYPASQRSNEASTTTLALPPAAPSGLSSTAVSNNLIDLAWTDNSGNESGFKIERKQGISGTYTQIALTAADVTTFSDTGLNEDTDYYYRIRATNQAGDSGYSNELSALTLLNPPASLTGSAPSDSQISLSWVDNSLKETGYKVERKIGIGGTYAEIADIPADSSSYNDTSLTEFTTYYYRTKAYNATPNSSSYTETSITTLLKFPTVLTAVSQSESQIDLTWIDNSANESNYQVERKEGVSGLYAAIATLPLGTVSYSDTGLTDGTRYYYRVRAVNGAVVSLYSNEDSAVTVLSAPGSLSSSPVSPSQITLTWADNSSSEQGFKIERKTGISGTYSQVATVSANTITYTDTGLIDGTTYYYKIRAANSEGDSLYSNETSAITPLGPPTGASASAISGSQIDITWVDNSATESGYRIERKIGAGGQYTEIGTVGADIISYSDTGLTDGLVYYYQVRAYSAAAGYSAYSNEASAITPIAPPTSLNATVISTSQIDLTWIDNSASEDGFKIERKQGVSGTYIQLPSVILADATAYSDTGLTDGTNYYYRIRATNSNGDSTYSNEVSVWTPLNPPTGLIATTQSESAIKIDWSDQSAAETGFKIERKVGVSGTYTEIATVGAGITTYTNSGLSEFTTYYYRVRATNSGGDSLYSNETSAVTKLNPPSSLIIQVASSSRLDLSWTDNSLAETGFSIERKTDQSGYSVIASPGQNTTVYNDTGVTDGVRYYYRVKAVASGEDSFYSNEASAITPLNPPSGLAASAVSNNQIDLTWTDNSSGETGYTIEQKTGSSGSYSVISQVGAGATSYNVTGLVDGIIYYYRLKAANSLTESLYSNESLAMTPLIPPSNLSASSTSNTSITLTWLDNTPSETGYKIERKTGAGGTYAEIAITGANAVTYLDTGLTGNTAYYYRIRATNAGGDSQYSNEASATTSLFAPSNLTAATLSPSQIRLDWSDNSIDETGFRIERKIGSGGTYTEIATVGTNITMYDDSGLTDSTQYYYRVRAYDINGNSSYSNEANAVTYPLPPAGPSGLNTQVISSSEIMVTWTDNSNNEDGFRIERSTDGVNYQQIATVGVGATSYNDTGLSPNTTYYYRVSAYNTGGGSGYSNTSSNSTLILDIPSGLSAATISDSEIDLTWSDNSSGETGFIIERSLDGVSFVQIAAVGQNITSYNNIGLSPNTTYYYRVKAYNGTGVSPYSNTASNTTYIVNPPSALSAAAISGSQIDLVWTDNSNNEDGFRIERKTGVSGIYAEITTVGPGLTSYSDTGLSAGTTYYYRVRAYNISGNSIYSNEANAMTTPPPPSAPGGLIAAGISSTRIGLNWTDNSNNETGFRIERRTGAAPYQEIATVSADITSYNDTGLTANTVYYYQIRAYNAGGNSGYSNEASTATLVVNPPSGLTANPVSIDSIGLNWTDNSNNETGFKIERKTGVGGTYSLINTVGQNITAYNDTGLLPDTTYYYRVAATNIVGDSPYSNEDSALTKLSLPSGLSAVTLSTNDIQLTWTDNSQEELFYIERREGNVGSFTQIDSVGAGTTTYLDSGLIDGKDYNYRVRGYKSANNNYSGYSNIAVSSTFLETPANLNAAATGSAQLRLTWIDNSVSEDGYEIIRKEGIGGTYTQIAVTGPSAALYDDTGLLEDRVYYYQVRAYNSTGNSPYSNEASALTLLIKPTNLTSQVISGTEVRIDWVDNSNREDGYRIERQDGAGGTYAEIAVVGAGVITYNDTGLTEDMTYYYRVRAYNNTNSNYSQYSGGTIATTLPPPPSAPTSLNITSVSHNQIGLNWTDNSANEDKFKIERKTGIGGTYIEIAIVGAGMTSYTDGGLNELTTYYYRVRAANTGGDSGYSNEVNATTDMNLPSNLTASVLSDSSISLNWTDTNSEISYYIERSTDGQNYTQIATVGADITVYTDTGLNEYTTYYYRVRGYDGSVYSAYSNSASAATLLKAPSGLNAVAQSDSIIQLTWTDNSGVEDGYKIERSLDGVQYTQIATGITTGAYTDTGLSDGTQYYYRVRAYKGTDNSGYSNAANETTPMIAPTGLNAVASSSYQIDLSWTDNSNNETGFKIERKVGTGGTYSLLTTVGTDITSYSDTGLTPETTYYYRIRGYNSNLGIQSFNSNDASAVTFLTPPSGLTATAQSTSQIVLSWTDNTALEDGFKIERSLSSGGPYSEIAAVGVNTASYSDTGLIDGTQYYYRVRAYKGAENSSPSNPENAVTALAAPTGLSAASVSNSQIDLIWTDTSSSETGFKIERKTGATGVYIQIALISSPDITSYSDTGLTDGTRYYYRVKSTNGIAGDSGYSNEANAVTGLNSPTGLSAASVSSSQIDLTWTDTSSSEIGFKIERKTGAGGAYAQIALTASGITSYSDTGLTDGTRYYYRLRTTNSIAGDSGYSNEANAVTGLNLPTGLNAASVSSSQIDLTWTDTSSSETGFKIERKTGAGGAYAQITLTGADITSYSDTGLTQGTLYYYRVRASNNDGDSAYSNETSAQTYSAPVLSFSSEFGYETLDGIHPNIGDISTSFTYKIIYTDADGQQPGGLKVYILKDGALLDANGYQMIKDDPGTNYQNGVQYKYTTTLPAGDVYAYYFYASDGMDTVRYPAAGSFSGPQVAPVLAELRFSNESGYNNDPDINNKGIEPNTGNTATAFAYKLEYGDSQNREPLSLRIHLDGDTIGKPLALDTYAATALKNGVYTDYEQYYYMLTLGEGTNHTYYFSLFDGQYEVRLPSSGILNGPAVSPAANSAPLLNYAQESPYNGSAGVSPNTGSTATLFTFKVIYNDSDFNNLPTYVKVHIDGDVEGVNMTLDNSASSALRDGNPFNGEQYYFRTSLNFGSHNFYFSASDGQNRVEMPLSGTINGPNVTSVASATTLSLSYSPDPGYNGVDGADPNIGDSTSYFTYKVVYTSNTNNPPAVLKVNLDGDMIGVPMKPDTLAGDPTLKDGNYQNGEQYYYVTKLAQGSHTYYFSASDGIESADLPAQDVRSGPEVGNTIQGSVTTNPVTDSTVATKPSNEVSVTFTQITSSGTTAAYRQTANKPPAPTGYKINNNAYYDISTTATFSGKAEVCINYSQDQLAGIGESSLRLFHYSSVTNKWEDITTSLDTVHNIICGLTTGFSTYGFGGKTPTLVTLTSFAAEVADNNIILRWTTASEHDNEGFNIYRKTSADGPLMRLNSSLIPSKGGLTSSSEYYFTDTTAERGKTYYYRIEDIDIHGIATLQSMISVTNIIDDAVEILPVRDDMKEDRTISDIDDTDMVVQNEVQIPAADREEDRIVYYDISSDEETEGADAEKEKRIDDDILRRYLFEVERDKESIKLVWKSSDRDEIGFNILRSNNEDGTYIRINPSVISLDTDMMIEKGQIIDYTYSDTDILHGDSYYYKLEIIVNNGDTIHIGPIPVKAAETKRNYSANTE
ncbi:MAG: fibronectin type III domain-containing protein [Nitrospirota bacterium]